MKFKIGAVLVMAILSAIAVVGHAGAAEKYGKQKVVYHINGDGGPESKAYKAALVNVQNHVNAVGKDNIDVKVVLHGDGVKLLMAAQAQDAERVVSGVQQHAHQPQDRL